MTCTILYILNSLLNVLTSNDVQPHWRNLLANSMTNISNTVGFVYHVLIGYGQRMWCLNERLTCTGRLSDVERQHSILLHEVQNRVVCHCSCFDIKTMLCRFGVKL